MKVIIPRKRAVKNVLSTLRSLTSTTKMPILQNVLLHGDGRAELTATDLAVTARFSVPGIQVEEEGRMLLPGGKLYDIFSRSESDVIIERTEDDVVIKIGSTKFSIPVRDPDDFPSVPHAKEEDLKCVVSGSDLLEAVGGVGFATSKEKKVSSLSGVHFKAEDTVLRCEATNRHILAEAKLSCDTKDKLDCVVGIETLKLAARSWADKKVRVFATDRSIVFRTPEAEVSGQLIEGRFPETESIFQQKPKLTLSIDREALTEALQRALIIALENYTNRITWYISNDDLEVHARNETGTVVSRVENVKVSKKGAALPFTISMDGGYMLQIVNRLKERIKVGMSLPTSPILIKDESEFNKYILMPQTGGGGQ